VTNGDATSAPIQQELERCRARIAELERELAKVTISAPLEHVVETGKNPIFELSRDALWVFDDSGVILRVNKAACELFGRTESQLVGAQVSSIQTPADSITAEGAFRRYIAAGADETGEFVFLRPDGQRCITEYASRRVAPGLHIVAFRDVGERRRTAEALRTREEQFQQLVSRMHIVFWMIESGTGSVLYISPAYEEIWGQTCESLIQNPESWWALVHPEDVERLRDALTRVARDTTFKGERVDFRVNRPDGGMRWVAVWAYPVPNATGEITRIAGITTDITNRKLAEEALQRAYDELETRVEERTAALTYANNLLRAEIAERIKTQEKLSQRQAELAHVQRRSTMIEMAGGLAHELNQPLAAAMNYAGSCLSQLDEPTPDLKELRSGIEQIINQAERAAEIIRRLREFLQKRDPRIDSLDLGDCIKEAVNLMQFETRRSQVKVTVELAEGLPPVLGDRILIEQVLVNLIRNAIDAMDQTPPEERELTIRTKLGPIGGVEVAVTDTGRGFSNAARGRLFQPFFTTKPGGLGMGLVISRSIVESHLGRLSIDRGDGRGATLRVTLPTLTETGNGHG